MLTLIACLQQTPPDHTGTATLESREIQVTAEDWDAARAQVDEQVPDGWRVIWLRVDRPAGGGPG